MQQAFERYYIAISVLVKNGPGTLGAAELESLCHLAAQRLSLLYAPAAPEFFDKSLFRGFIQKLRELKLVWPDQNSKLLFDDRLNVWAKDAKLILGRELRHTIERVSPEAARPETGSLHRRTDSPPHPAQAGWSGISRLSSLAMQSFSCSLRRFRRLDSRSSSGLAASCPIRSSSARCSQRRTEMRSATVLGSKVSTEAKLTPARRRARGPCSSPRPTAAPAGRMAAMSAVLPLPEPAPRSRNPPDPRVVQREQIKLAKRLRRHQVGWAIADFGMIEAGDKVMVCLSGGKDSYTMLDILLQLQRKAPVPFELVAVNLDQKQPGFPEHVLPEYLRSLGVPFHIIEQDTYSVVTRVVPEGKTMCSLCSRMRRGALYSYAAAHGFTKIALGHHRDDPVATFFLNLFHHAKLSGMPPKLLSDDGQHVVIRPLAYVREADIVEYADARRFPIIPCNLCGSQENLQRKQVGLMMKQWERESPGRIETIARALGDIRPSQLSDPKLFDFLAPGPPRRRRRCRRPRLAGRQRGR